MIIFSSRGKIFRMPNASQILPINFLKEVKSELKKVSWPTRQEATKLTGIVIAISLAVGIFIGFFDYIFTKLMAILLKK